MTIPYTKHHVTWGDVEAVKRTLLSDRLTQGQEAERFERALCDHTDTTHAVAVNSGTSALHLACLAAGVREGTEVILPTLTFSATINAVLMCGGTPVIVDVNEHLNIDVEQVRENITDNTVAVIGVDFAGLPCDHQGLIYALHEAKNPPALIIDAAHSFGAEYNDRPVGVYADMTCFSFHPAKVITTGEGGAVVTNQPHLASKMRRLRSHGQVREGKWRRRNEEVGYNYRMPDILAALGRSQLDRLGENILVRREWANRYDELGMGYLDEIPPYRTHAWHIYPALFDDRERAYDALQSRGIGVQVHYQPLHRMRLYRDYTVGEYPNAESYYQKALTLPLYPQMTEQEFERVCAAVESI